MAAAERGFYAGARTFSWLANLIDLPLDQVNFLICQFIALAFAIFYRKVLHPCRVTPEVRHTAALVVGIALGYFSFGYQISHICVQATLFYIIFNSVSPQVMHVVVLFISMLYLSSMHLLRLKYDYGGWTVDITGPLMITTQKVTSMAFSIHDGLTRDKEKLSHDQSRQAIRQKPTLLEFFSYIFHFQAIMCGPLIFFNDYIDFIEGKHLKLIDEKKDTISVEEASSNNEVAKKFISSILWALFLLYFVPRYPIQYLVDEKFLYQTPWYSKLLYLMITTFACRSKYYHAWLLGEAIGNASGLGFNGYTANGKPRWDLISNVDIIGFEFAPNMKGLLEAWNKSTQTWLKMVAYDRVKKHKTLFTYLLSAMWHGFYPGYYLTFLGGAMLTTAGRNIRRSVRPLFQTSKELSTFYDIITIVTTKVALAYVVFPFVLLEFNASIIVYKSFYFLGHILVLGGIFIIPTLSQVIRSKPKSVTP